jgi:hypothetical protein
LFFEFLQSGSDALAQDHGRIKKKPPTPAEVKRTGPSAHFRKVLPGGTTPGRPADLIVWIQITFNFLLGLNSH